MLNFRKSTLADIDAAVKIADQGKALLKSRGVNQWQRGTYPDRNVFENDVKNGIGYVVCNDDEVVAVCAVTFTEEPSYKNLTSGEWKTSDEQVYATIHRSAVKTDFRGHGVFGFLVQSVMALAKEQNAASIRIDTHEDNLSMQGALKKSNFEYCCKMLLVDGDEQGDPRLGFELVF